MIARRKKTCPDYTTDNIFEEPATTRDVAPENVEPDAAEVNDPAERLKWLFEEEPGYVDVYRMVLEYCFEERAMPEIEYLLRAHPALTNPKVYPSYLVDRLKLAGALKWAGKWRTAEAIKNMI